MNAMEEMRLTCCGGATGNGAGTAAGRVANGEGPGGAPAAAAAAAAAAEAAAAADMIAVASRGTAEVASGDLTATPTAGRATLWFSCGMQKRISSMIAR